MSEINRDNFPQFSHEQYQEISAELLVLSGFDESAEDFFNLSEYNSLTEEEKAAAESELADLEFCFLLDEARLSMEDAAEVVNANANKDPNLNKWRAAKLHEYYQEFVEDGLDEGISMETILEQWNSIKTKQPGQILDDLFQFANFSGQADSDEGLVN